MPGSRASARSQGRLDDVESIASSVLTASRALMGVAVRSIASVEDDVTLVQYRALVLLVSRGEQNVSDLADALGIHASTATRLCDRLVAKGYVDRVPSPDSRRETNLSATAKARAVVRTVSTRRRREVTRIVEQLPRVEQLRLKAAFETFAAAAAEMELPEDAWKLGWTH